MKKKFLTTLLTIFALSTCLFTFTACIHPHSFTNYISDNNATYEADGTKTATCDWNGCNETDTIIDEGSKLFSSQGLTYVLNSDNQSYSLTGIGDCADTSIVIPSTHEGKPVTRIGNYAFYNCTSLLNIKIPNSVTSIGDSAFQYCENLKNVIMSNSVTTIGNSAFIGCTSLKYNVKGGLKYLGIDTNQYFYLADTVDTNITTATIDSNCKFIGSSAFSWCDSLTNVEIPNSVTSIGDYAFDWCSALISVTIGNGVTSIGEQAFYNCSKLTNIEIDVNNSEYKDIDGDLYSKDGTILIQYAIGKTQTSFTVPSHVTKINNYAFESCNDLTEVVITDNVTSIGNKAFYRCGSLTSITFNDNLAWYMTTNYNNFINKTNGTQVDVTNSSTNATNFKSNYYVYYWYKK